MKNKRLRVNKYILLTIGILLFACSAWFALQRNLLLVLYNSEQVTAADLAAIKDYSAHFNSRLIDVHEQSTAADIYQLIKSKYSQFPKTIKGIQIFGIAADVPAFHFKFKCKNSEEKGDIDTAWGNFVSDFCYSNFVASSNDLQEQLQIYDIMDINLPFSFIPEWQVARVPLTKNEISSYMKKYAEFKKRYPENMLPMSIFVCTVVDEPGIPDDIGYFVRERLDKEFALIKKPYKIFGNSVGVFPIVPRDGDFLLENVIKENQDGVKNFIIRSHGYKTRIRHSITHEGATKRTQYKFLDTSNVNEAFKYNYYTLNSCACYIARDMDDRNFLHEIMTGNCMNALATTSILSHNEDVKDAPLEELGNNNLFFFHYKFFQNLNKGLSRPESFSLAKADYARAILQHQDQYNYQYNLHNVVAYHYFGLI
ncbi:MAG: hypothetical protein LBJ38_03730 [Oscillospiraceae bacterium]|nr:hypothetical protein [Oscillospiraceae bacterium]